MAMAQRLVEDGYAAVGYKYVNVRQSCVFLLTLRQHHDIEIDDCWSSMERAKNGSIVCMDGPVVVLH